MVISYSTLKVHLLVLNSTLNPESLQPQSIHLQNSKNVLSCHHHGGPVKQTRVEISALNVKLLEEYATANNSFLSRQTLF